MCEQCSKASIVYDVVSYLQQSYVTLWRDVQHPERTAVNRSDPAMVIEYPNTYVINTLRKTKGTNQDLKHGHDHMLIQPFDFVPVSNVDTVLLAP